MPNQNLNKEQAVFGALLHDLNQTITGSTKHETKNSAGVGKYIKMLEESASKKIVDSLSTKMKNSLSDFILDAENENTFEGNSESSPFGKYCSFNAKETNSFSFAILA